MKNFICQSIDKIFSMRYDKNMTKIAIIGGGAAGMACAVHLARQGCCVTLLERGERLGRKLAATGNGQGNVTNTAMGQEFYFSDDPDKVGRALLRFSNADTVRMLEDMGGIFLPDGRGRVYPAGRQASAIVDLFRRELSRCGVDVRLGARVRSLSFSDGFHLGTDGGDFGADRVVLAAGGKAAEHFGTDGSAYALAEGFGHTVSPLSPALVRLKTQPALVRGLKGIRVDGALGVVRGNKTVFSDRGDILFTDGGVSGDLVFRASSYAREGDILEIDFLPDVAEERVRGALSKGEGEDGLLCLVPNGLGRFLLRTQGDRLASALKKYRLPVTGTFGFREAQVTRGGIPLAETDETLQSIKRKGLFFAGEILNVDGVCGGYNLQWAFTSAFLAAEGAMRC